MFFHLIAAAVIVAGAWATFDSSAPMHRLSLWLILLAGVGLTAGVGFVSWSRYVAIDLANQRVTLSGRPLVLWRVTRHYPLNAFAGVRSLLARSNVKQPWRCYLELVSRDERRGLLLLSEDVGRNQAEPAEIAHFRSLISSKTALLDMGHVGQGRRLSRFKGQ